MPEPVLPPPPPPVRRRAAPVPEASTPDGQLAAARALTALAPVHLASAPSFQSLPADTQGRILRELDKIHAGLNSNSRAEALGTPMDFRRGGAGAQPAQPPDAAPAPADGGGDAPPGTAPRRQQATDTIAHRAGALSDEIDFPAFVAGLIHNTFDAIVDAAIRQMEAFADLVSSVARTAEDFARDNVSVNAARDWLASKYPADLRLDLQAEGGPQLLPRAPAAGAAGADGAEGDTPHSPGWLADFGLADQELTPELINEQLVPKARERVGRDRQQMLATMVLLGMNRVVVKDGTITARLQFRAVAADKSKVDYAVSDDPTGGGSNWGTRGSDTYAAPSTKVSTLGVNVQSESTLNAQLFGEVKINFASETLPLDRFVDDARRTLLERHARPPDAAARPAPPPLTPPAQLPPPVPVQAAPPPARGG
jgi:hypothetical protein